jgi:hypothetical protein
MTLLAIFFLCHCIMIVNGIIYKMYIYTLENNVFSKDFIS